LADAVVTGLAVAAVKGTRVRPVTHVELGPHGAEGNRAFYVVDERGRMVNGKQLGELQAVVSDYDLKGGTLDLSFPDRRSAWGAVRYGEKMPTRLGSVEVWGREVVGPWAAALSEFTGRSLRLVEAGPLGIDRGRRGAVSLISSSSVRRLAEVGGTDGVDARRFRMLVEIDGVEAHEEDGWVGRRVRVGPALVAMHGNVGRCLVTSRDPDSGEIDLPTLDLLGSYRREVDSTEPLPFGIHGEVLKAGSVSIGDSVALDG
jgi:uncharacterized protein YcbX